MMSSSSLFLLRLLEYNSNNGEITHDNGLLRDYVVYCASPRLSAALNTGRLQARRDEYVLVNLL